jgi:hypothetical protein
MPGIAFRRPFSADTQERRDSIDLSSMETADVGCRSCPVLYLLVYPRHTTAEKAEEYRNTILNYMADCQAHPPIIELNF